LDGRGEQKRTVENRREKKRDVQSIFFAAPLPSDATSQSRKKMPRDVARRNFLADTCAAGAFPHTHPTYPSHTHPTHPSHTQPTAIVSAQKRLVRTSSLIVSAQHIYVHKYVYYANNITVNGRVRSRRCPFFFFGWRKKPLTGRAHVCEHSRIVSTAAFHVDSSLSHR